MDSIAVPYQSCLPKHFPLTMTLHKINKKAVFTPYLLAEVLTPWAESEVASTCESN